MACEILKCCQFFVTYMKELPRTAQYIQSEVCHGNYESCVRYVVYKEFGGESVPFNLLPDDLEEVKKVLHCLRTKRASDG